VRRRTMNDICELTGAPAQRESIVLDVVD
jgi:hypothetical protein